MRYDDYHERRPETLTEWTLWFVKERFLSIIAVIVLVGLAFVLVGVDLGIPRWLRLSGLTMIVLSPFAYLVGSSITGMLPDPPGEILVDIDARKMDGAVFWFPTDDFRQLTVTEGELNQVAPSLYFGKQVDLDEMTAIGTWRGTLSDRQLLRGLQKVYECRGQLEDDAKKGFVLETQAFTLLRNAVRETTAVVVETFQRGTLPDEGEGLDHQIEQALEQFDLDDRIDDELSDLDDLDADEALLDPDGDRDLDEQAAEQVGDRVDHDAARADAAQEVPSDD
ncbi:hypothetical protein ACFR9U_04205 [Halorientalis brevis]|uniref:DUF8125 domain-containing protein n=1 Tax=Halorientalis brevis TaxID=1126241 RepID=A0ABD6C8L8_9EURY|nr:hypothetical protein [Halorientalis brevis]